MEKRNKHHIIPQAMGGSDHRRNIVDMVVHQHRGLHDLFYIDLPHEQIEKLISTYDTALQKSFKKDIMDVLGKHYGKYYHKEVFK